jgi:hypothetical protein
MLQARQGGAEPIRQTTHTPQTTQTQGRKKAIFEQISINPRQKTTQRAKKHTKSTQNKPNLKNPKITVTPVITKVYAKKPLYRPQKNKPNIHLPMRQPIFICL